MIEVLIRPILEFLFVLWVIRMIMKLASSAMRRPNAPPRSAPGERAGGTLVRDPQCGTYVAVSRAVRVGSGDQATYFCSAQCRDAHAAAQGH
jgi:hypothetical protein